MSYVTSFDQSNKADWAFDVSATDADTGDAIDFTDATVSFAVDDENGCQVLSGSIGSGITLSDPNTLSFLFTATQMTALCPGSYKVGAIYTLNGSTNQIFVGTVFIYDGVVG